MRDFETGERPIRQDDPTFGSEPVAVESDEIDPEQQLAVKGIGRYFIIIGALGTFIGCWNYLILNAEKVEITSYLVSGIFGLVLLKDKLTDNIKTRVKLAYGLAVMPIYLLLADGIVVAGFQFLISVCTIYILIKRPPKWIYYAAHSIYVFVILLLVIMLAFTLVGSRMDA